MPEPRAATGGHDWARRIEVSGIVAATAIGGFAWNRDIWAGGDTRIPALEIVTSLILIAAGVWVARRVVSGGRRFYASALVAGGEFGIMVAYATLPHDWGNGAWFTELGVACLSGVTFVFVLTATRLERNGPPTRVEAVVGCLTLAFLVLVLLLAVDVVPSRLGGLRLF